MASWMQPASATNILRSLDSTHALDALDEMWKLQANVHWCQCCNPQKGVCVTMDQGLVWVNCELSSAISLDAYLLIQQAEVNVFHISAVVGACGKDCLGGVHVCKQ